MGGLIRRILEAGGYNSTVIDYNSRRIDIMGRFGVKTYYGDATRPDLLHAAGVANAKLFVIAINDRDQITELTKHLLQNYPNLHVLARAVDRDHVYDLWLAGCRDIIRETYDSSIRMGRSAFEALGIDKPHAQAMVDAFNRVDRRSMIEVASVYDPDIPLHENEAYIQKVKEVMGPRRDELWQEMNKIRGLD
jgi:CPA2 family monovalent cation:H+ antiporter-2